MPPSRKRPATSPADSPAKKRPSDAPAPAPLPPAVSTPGAPLTEVQEAKKWLIGLGTQVASALNPLLGSTISPGPTLPLFHDPELFFDACDQVRDFLMDYINLADALVAKGPFIPADTPPCPAICPAAKLPVVDHKSVSTDPADEPMAIDPPLPRTYASVATEAPATPLSPKPANPGPTAPGPKGPKPAQTTRPKPKGLGVAPLRSAGAPVRLIVRPAPIMSTSGMPFSGLFLNNPSHPFQLLTHTLALSPVMKGVRLLGVHQNRRKNLVLSLAPGTSDADVAAVLPVACAALTTDLSPTPAIERDVPWSKMLVSSVPARPEAGAPTYPEADVQASLLMNPAVLALKITRPPQWIRNPASITGAHSSFTISFEDPDGLLACQLAKSSLFIFGTPVHLKRWVDKPLAKWK